VIAADMADIRAFGAESGVTPSDALVGVLFLRQQQPEGENFAGDPESHGAICKKRGLRELGFLILGAAVWSGGCDERGARRSWHRGRYHLRREWGPFWDGGRWGGDEMSLDDEGISGEFMNGSERSMDCTGADAGVGKLAGRKVREAIEILGGEGLGMGSPRFGMRG